MIKPRIAKLFLSLAAVCASTAFAQQVDIKPGLWQLDVTMPGANIKGNPMAGLAEQMKRQMASMPPEQRKDMEKALADLDASGTEFTDGGVRTKVCFTKEDIAKFDLLGKKGADGCTRKGNAVPGGATISMVCTKPKMKVDASVRYAGDKAYTFESTVTQTAPDGSTTTQKSNGTGKWLSGDCGKVKPLTVNG
jgi:hypothetical protein